MSRREQERKKLLEYPCPEQDPLNITGVLLSDEIEYYVDKYKMIDPFVPGNLKPSAYELTVGDEYAIGSKLKTLTDKFDENIIKIEPFQVVIIKTTEIVNLPRFLIARWNIRVKWAYEGLLWVGGPQIYPGWVGHLFCPLYNLSNKVVILKLGDPIAVIDFVKTTNYRANVSDKYPRPPKRILLEEYDLGLQSALFSEVPGKIKEIDKKITGIDNEVENKITRVESFIENKITRVESVISLVFTSIAILFAALAIIISAKIEQPIVVPIWIFLSIGLSIIAISISMFSRIKTYEVYRSSIIRVIYMIFYALIFASLAAIVILATRNLLW